MAAVPEGRGLSNPKDSIERPAHSRRDAPGAWSRVLNGLLLLGSVALALALGEALARATASSWRVDVVATDASGESLYTHDPLYGWRKRPSMTAAARTPEYDNLIETDSLGLRGPETTRAKPPGTKRILMLGDSYLEGYSVGYDDLVSTRLERQLEGSGHDVEVLNAGTAGYATDQELLYFVQDGRAFEPDVTVLLFYLNDVYYNARSSYWRGPKPWFELSESGLVMRGVPLPAPGETQESPSPVDRGGPSVARLLRQADSRLFPNSALYRLVRDVFENSATISGLAIRLGAFEVPGEYGPWRRNPDDETAHAWRVTAALIERLREETAAAGSELLVFYVPTVAAVYDRDWRRARRAYAMDDEEWSPTADAETLGEICSRIQVDCVIPLEAFRSEAERAVDSDQPLYFPVDRHWTPAGHDLAAREIAKHLRGSL